MVNNKMKRKQDEINNEDIEANRTAMLRHNQ